MPRTALETSSSVSVVTADTGRMTEEPGLDSPLETEKFILFFRTALGQTETRTALGHTETRTVRDTLKLVQLGTN